MQEFKVMLNAASINKASIGDLFEIDGNISIVTLISNRYVYIDGVPHNRKIINGMKRNYIKQYNDNKSWLLSGLPF
jgi:hypothetical protein|tara:strand:- start:5093 stop:5320 length:228 start_codon:yes stop_codon:yes gene_type:complete